MKDMDKHRQAFEALCVAGKCAGPATESVIQQAEQQLGTNFPEEYREFLKKNGALVSRGVELYGLPDAAKNDPPIWQNVVEVTSNLRTLGQLGSDDLYLIPFSDDGSGVYYFFDTRESPATKIVALGPGVDSVVGGSLFEFVANLKAGRLP